jgi:hypothetical protein
MRRVVAAEYLSVDGRMEMDDPEGEEQELGGWTAPYWNDAASSCGRSCLTTSSTSSDS